MSWIFLSAAGQVAKIPEIAAGVNRIIDESNGAAYAGYISLGEKRRMELQRIKHLYFKSFGIAFFRMANGIAGNKRNSISARIAVSMERVGRSRCISRATVGVPKIPAITIGVLANVGKSN